MNEFKIGDRVSIEHVDYFESIPADRIGTVCHVYDVTVNVCWDNPFYPDTTDLPVPITWHKNNLKAVEFDDKLLRAEGVLVMPNPIELESIEMSKEPSKILRATGTVFNDAAHLNNLNDR